MVRCFFSTNHKDIGTLYSLFGLWGSILWGGLSGLIRAELSQPGIVVGDDQFYNVIVISHIMIMIFFVFVPVMIFGFCSYLIPLVLGVPDKFFSGANNMMRWLLSSFSLMFMFVIAGSGVGMGWAVSFYPDIVYNSGGASVYSSVFFLLLASFFFILGVFSFLSIMPNSGSSLMSWEWFNFNVFCFPAFIIGVLVPFFPSIPGAMFMLFLSVFIMIMLFSVSLSNSKLFLFYFFSFKEIFDGVLYFLRLKTPFLLAVSPGLLITEVWSVGQGSLTLYSEDHTYWNKGCASLVLLSDHVANPLVEPFPEVSNDPRKQLVLARLAREVSSDDLFRASEFYLHKGPVPVWEIVYIEPPLVSPGGMANVMSWMNLFVKGTY